MGKEVKGKTIAALGGGKKGRQKGTFSIRQQTRLQGKYDPHENLIKTSSQKRGKPTSAGGGRTKKNLLSGKTRSKLGYHKDP